MSVNDQLEEAYKKAQADMFEIFLVLEIVPRFFLPDGTPVLTPDDYILYKEFVEKNYSNN